MADRARPAPVDVYLFPAALGGGSGDIDEVYVAGEVLRRAGARVRLWRSPGRPLPAGVDDPSRWPAVPRVTRIDRRRPWAVTVSAAWGVTAAPQRPGPLGRAGPWAEESEGVEAAYGRDRTVHVSVEEFARTLTSREQSRERYREGGRPTKELDRIAGSSGFRGEVHEFRRAYRRFRGFGTANLLSLFPGFVRSARFQREFPEAVQTGPLWPGRYRPDRRRSRPNGRWLWYADSLSAEQLGRGIVAGLARSGRRPRLDVRFAAGPLPDGLRAPFVGALPSLGRTAWSRRFRSAELRVVTGSRSLLEALELGRPFLYFNGVTGRGRRTRLHRPEKLRQLLEVWAARNVAPQIARDVRAFAAGKRVPEIVERATRSGWQRRFPRTNVVRGYAPPFDSANHLLAFVVGELRAAEARGRGAAEVVTALRRRSDPAASPRPKF